MAQKRVAAMLKLQIPAGQASPAPPVGPALGQHGINIMDFVNAYNQETQAQAGTIIPVEITIYEDRTFSFVTKTPPAAVLLRQAARVAKGSPEPNRAKVGAVTPAQIREIAQIKMPDLNANNIDGAAKIIEGTARSMGLLVGDSVSADELISAEELEALKEKAAEAAPTAAAPAPEGEVGEEAAAEEPGPGDSPAED